MHRVDELHHQLVVGDPEVAEAAEAGAAVHEEVEQRPALGAQDVVDVVRGGVGLVDRAHQLVGDVREALGAAEVVVDDAGGRRRGRVDDVVRRELVAQRLAVVVVEDQVRGRRVREVGEDVALGDLDDAVLHVLGVHEGDLVDHAELLQQDGADEAVEVAAGHEPVLGGHEVLFSLGALARPSLVGRTPARDVTRSGGPGWAGPGRGGSVGSARRPTGAARAEQRRRRAAGDLPGHRRREPRRHAGPEHPRPPPGPGRAAALGAGARPHRAVWGQPVKGLFFLNASSGHLPMPFVQALLALGFRPVPLSGPPGMKVVDVGIQRMLEAIAERDADVVLGSHDGDFLPQVQALLGGGRRVALLGFREFVNGGYAELADDGLQVFDLETDAKAFTRPLPRVRILDIDAFDPAAFL